MLFPIEKIDFQVNLQSDLIAYNELDHYIPWKVKQIFERLGFTNVEVFQTTNLAKTICLAYEKSYLKQWKVLFTLGEKSFVRKLIEYPYLDNDASAIINGIKKIFPIKLKRRNVRVYFASRLNIHILSLVNLRNNKLDLLMNNEHCWINVYGKRYRLVDFIVFKVYEQLSLFRLLSRDTKLISDICNLPFELLDTKGILQPSVLIRLLKYSLSNPAFFDDKNLIHKCFMTYGGHLKDLIERAWEVNNENSSETLHVNKLKEIINKRLNLNDLNGRIINYYMDSSFAQILEEINPISSLIHRRKVSLLYKGLLSKVNATEASRKHAGYQLGRVCPLSTSEGQSVGLILHLASGAKFNKYDELLVPYNKVSNGKIGQLMWLLPYQEMNVYITDKQTWQNNQPYILAKFNNGYQVVNREDIDYVFHTIGQVYSFGVNSISRLNNSENDRVTTGSNMCRQAIILANPKPCYVTSYFLRKGVNCCPGYKQLKDVVLSNSMMAITNERGNFTLHKFGRWSRTNSGTVQMLQRIKSNELVPYMYGNDCLLLGQVMHVGYMQYEGYTFEDAVVVSESGAEKLTSIHLEEIEIPVMDTESGPEKVTRDLINSYKYNLDNLDQNGIVKPNSYLRTNDLLVAKTKPITLKEDSPEQKFMKTLIHGRSYNVVNSVYALPRELDGSFVMSVSCTLGQARKFPMDVSSYETSSDYTSTVNRLARLRAGEEWKVYTQGLMGEKVRLSRELRAQLVKDMAALKQLREDVKLREKREVLKVSKQECLYSIKVVLLREKRLEIGDKLTGMHGNKGILSAILPDQDMPYTEEGQPLEIIISNLSVYGRLNLGQVSESYLSKLCYLSELLINDPYVSKAKLTKLYELINHDVDLNLDDWLSKSRIDGVRLLDNPSMQLDKLKLREWENLVGFKFLSRLRDGKSGRLLDNPVHHGWISIMKLTHTSEGKFSSRSIGDYSHKFCQPSRGKRLSNHLGMAQKLGNMEIMGLLARNLHNFLHEIHLKSDYILYKKWVITGLYKLERLRNIQEHTEAFKVLLRYFSVLGIKTSINYGSSF